MPLNSMDSVSINLQADLKEKEGIPAQSGVVHWHKTLQSAPHKVLQRRAAFLYARDGGFSTILGCLHIVGRLDDEIFRT